MSDDSNSSSWTRGLKRWLSTAPETRDDLLKLVQDSRQFLEPDTVAMLEGVLDMPATKVREIMTPRTAMVSLQEHDVLDEILDVLIDSAHSRFPVFAEHDPETVVGILLVKDLLTVVKNKTPVDICSFIRTPLFIPETARADQALRMLKNTQSHIAIVIDEYGSTVGLVTLEDILEEIVGEIEDEHDHFAEETDWIKKEPQSNSWLVQALTPIELFNEQLNTQFPDEEVETMAGLLLQEIGFVSDLKGQVIELDQWRFTILEADERTIVQIRAEKLGKS